MIIGTGLLAKALNAFVPKHDAVCYLAAGVSNSAETNPHAFERERLLVEKHLKSSGRLVYFGRFKNQLEEFFDISSWKH
jgi:hypothetical protein